MCQTLKKKTVRNVAAALAASLTLWGQAGCGMSEDASQDAKAQQKIEIQVFVAASLYTAMQELGEMFQEEHPEVELVWNADSSGKLLTQIEEGYACDLFFPAAQKQMDQLEDDGFVVPESRRSVLKNQLVVVTGKGSRTAVTGLSDLEKAKSIALAGGSVPAGMYTRNALIALGILPETDDPSKISTKEVSEALGGVEISEQENVSKVLLAVAEGACEVGTTYRSDLYGYEDQVEILEQVSDAWTGEVIYPICLVEDREASEAQRQAAKWFWEFLISDEAAECMETYGFQACK